MTTSTVKPGALLRPAPPRSEWHRSRIGSFLLDVERRTGRRFDDYDMAWQWSIDHLDEFWAEIWDWFDIIAHSPHTAVIGSREMPGAQWFPGATLNYAEHIVRELAARPDRVAIHSRSQTTGSTDWTGRRILDEIGRIQRGLVRLGVGRGDRVAAYLPSIPETVAAYLATTGLGAIWCSVAPEMGATATAERIAQLEPSVVLAVDGYRWGTKAIDRRAEVTALRAALPAARFVALPYLEQDRSAPEGIIPYADFVSEPGPVTTEPVPFAHPLVVLFSSGTTGRPKAIVHSHGGILIEHLKSVGLHQDFGRDDTAFYYTTTGWMVWNLMVSSLLLGTSIVLLDGDPSWPALDGPWSQWAIAAETGATFVGTSAGYLAAWAHSGLRPTDLWDLSRLREITSAGSPLAADVSAWVHDTLGPAVLLAATSGGTDVCTAFLGGSPLVGVYAGEMSSRPLGVDVDSLDGRGDPVHEVPGELVARQPMPSMPVFFWGDEDFARYRSSYFDQYPGMWRHGDWLIHTSRDTWVITGRSDATLNRGGVRIGTAEFYAVLDAHPGVADSLVLHFEDADGMGRLVLAISVTRPELDPTAFEAEIRSTVRTQLSPRHSPDHIVIVSGIPRNRTGKRLEIPIKRIVKGEPIAEVLDLSVVVDPDTVAETAARITAVLDTAATPVGRLESAADAGRTPLTGAEYTVDGARTAH
ncbi:acetoacetate--CoA ligase [Nocardia sienata]|uniref:acetoacetate--CoA ligase n=1 Tax=Nocardia sienata TaxID=248552 RepID=UPI000A0638AF|nr:acetoacetate--CoA ligase [Nocardia sienata]